MNSKLKNNQNINQKTNVRHYPETFGQAVRMAASHVARYYFAEKYAVDKRVCDVGCGAGYGSNYLAQKACHVSAMDISEDAISWASKHFGRNNLRFFAANAAEKWRIDNKFDVITTFETMEHVQNPNDFLARIHEHLLPGGTLILSVPNGPRDEDKTNNPYHIHHFTDTDLKDLFEKYFSETEYFSQDYKKDIKHYGSKFLKKIKLLKKQPYFVNNFYLLPGLDHKLKTWIVFARK
jgi:2-polyprenyl-3-methyl-5-hydroxy-6-metoxy-1,4-benzoquinol methylase